MPERSSIDAAAGLLRGQLTMAASDTEAALAAFVRFGRMRFRTAETPDADGLLFQYGVFEFEEPPTFLLSFTRQFEISDEEGDHDHFVQVHCELTYEPVRALRNLQTFDSWFFHDAGVKLDRWVEEMTSREAWTIIRRRRPVRIKVSEEVV